MKYIAECAYVNVANVLGIIIIHCQSTYKTIDIVANSYCRPLLRKPGGVYYESLECEHRASQIMQLIGVREGTVSLPGFDDGLLDNFMLCCD